MAARSTILHNFWLKFFSVALATAIWMVIHHGIQKDIELAQPAISHMVAQENLKIPIFVVVQPGDGRTFKIDPQAVVVCANGEEDVFEKSKNRIKVYVDLANFHEKRAVEELQTQSPEDIHVIKVTPSVVTVEQISP